MAEEVPENMDEVAAIRRRLLNRQRVEHFRRQTSSVVGREGSNQVMQDESGKQDLMPKPKI